MWTINYFWDCRRVAYCVDPEEWFNRRTTTLFHHFRKQKRRHLIVICNNLTNTLFINHTACFHTYVLRLMNPCWSYCNVLILYVRQFIWVLRNKIKFSKKKRKKRGGIITNMATCTQVGRLLSISTRFSYRYVFRQYLHLCSVWYNIVDIPSKFGLFISKCCVFSQSLLWSTLGNITWWINDAVHRGSKLGVGS